MRRQPIVRCAPCILSLRRSVSNLHRYSPSANLAASFAARIVGAKQAQNAASSPHALANQKTVEVYDPSSGEEVTVNLNTVEPFSPTFALLPMHYRIEVERRHLLKTLRERQSAAYEVVQVEEDDGSVQPDPVLVKQYVNRFLRNRRAKTDVAPHPTQIAKYLQMAKDRAIEVEKKRTKHDQAEAPTAPELSFEAQWKRRERYGTYLEK